MHYNWSANVRSRLISQSEWSTSAVDILFFICHIHRTPMMLTDSIIDELILQWHRWFILYAIQKKISDDIYIKIRTRYSLIMGSAETILFFRQVIENFLEHQFFNWVFIAYIFENDLSYAQESRGRAISLTKVSFHWKINQHFTDRQW